MTSLPTFFPGPPRPPASPVGRRGAPGTLQHHRVPSQAGLPIVSPARLSRRAGSLRAEDGGDGRCGGAPRLPFCLRFSCSKGRFSATPAANRRPQEPPSSRVSARGVPQVGQRAQFVQHSGSLPSSFSHTYLRHSVSAQADYCPDVVAALLHSSVEERKHAQLRFHLPTHLPTIQHFSVTLAPILSGYFKRLNQPRVSVFLKPASEER